MSVNVVEKLASLQPTLFEEESYSFLIFYQSFKPWYFYDSESLGLEFVNTQINKFSLLDGRIPFLKNVSSDLFVGVSRKSMGVCVGSVMCVCYCGCGGCQAD